MMVISARTIQNAIEKNPRTGNVGIANAGAFRSELGKLNQVFLRKKFPMIRKAIKAIIWFKGLTPNSEITPAPIDPIIAPILNIPWQLDMIERWYFFSTIAAEALMVIFIKPIARPTKNIATRKAV